MGMFHRFIKTEKRSLENPNAPVSSEDFLHIIGWDDFSSAAGSTDNVDNALGVPVVWVAKNFFSGTLSSLRLEIYRSTDTGHLWVRGGLGAWLGPAFNPTPSFLPWRRTSLMREWIRLQAVVINFYTVWPFFKPRNL